ncbi:hypothetical protein [Vibrio phage Va2]|nr:hypothetical protein [Vibrio phage Va2]
MSSLKLSPANELYVYIASPLFCEEDLATIKVIEQKLEEYGIRYFSPRKEGGNLAEVAPEQRQAAAKEMFDMNDMAIRECNVIIGNLDSSGAHKGSRWSDIGTVWELGMAYTKKVKGDDQKIITLSSKGYGSNLMLAFSTDVHLANLSDFDQFMDSWLRGCEYQEQCEIFHKPTGDLQ